MRRKKIWLWSLLIVVSAGLIYACTKWRFTPDVQGRIIPLFVQIDFQYWTPFRYGVERAELVRLYRGLPHLFFEKDRYEKERRTQKTKRLKGYRFYVDPIELPTATFQALQSIFLDENAVREWSGQKRCGGFSPDLALEWKTPHHNYVALVCLSCGELKVFSPTGKVYCDLTPESAGHLEKILKPYLPVLP